MKTSGRFWKVFSLVALLAILTLGYVVRTRAFTLIENQSFVLPYVFNSSVFGQVKVSNITPDKSLTVSIAIIDDAGTVFQQSPAQTVAPGHTFTLPINRIAVGAAGQSLRPVVTINGAENFSSVLIGLLVFNGNNQIIAIVPAVQLPAGN